MDTTYTLERRVSSTTNGAGGGTVSVSVEERRFRGSLESVVGSTSTPKPLESEEEFVDSLRSLGSTSTPFVTANSTMLSIKESPRPSRIPRPSPRPSVLPRLRESPLSDSSREFRTPSTTFTTSPESDDQKAVRKYLRPKRRITFVGINPSGSKFVSDPSCHGQFCGFLFKILDFLRGIFRWFEKMNQS